MTDLSDFDVCFCGDYRRDHRDGKGACAFNAYPYNGGVTHGFQPCTRFRLVKEADPEDPNVQRSRNE